MQDKSRVDFGLSPYTLVFYLPSIILFIDLLANIQMKSRILLSATAFIKEKVITYCCLSLFFSLFFTGSFTNASAQTKISRTQHIAVRKTAAADTPNSNAPIIDYFVVFDPSGKAVAERRGGMAKYAQEVVDSINSVLRNSHVNGRFRLAGHM